MNRGNEMRRLAAAMCVAILCALPCHAREERAAAAAERAAAWLTETVARPEMGSVGGEWLVLGLARSGAQAPEGYFAGYLEGLREDVAARAGVLNTRKYSEYSRVVLALTALGETPGDVAGYDLLAPLGDHDAVVYQGVNGAIWALIALDSGNYAVASCPAGGTQASRAGYLSYILEAQREDGGWALAGGASDPDLTAMALQALAGYRGDQRAADACARGLALLSATQEKDGGYSGLPGENSESCAQVLMALCALDVELTDSRFVKEGNTVLDALLSYQRPDGSFLHVRGTGQGDLMATEQALMALAAVGRMEAGDGGLFRMTDGVAREMVSFVDVLEFSAQAMGQIAQALRGLR